MNETAQENKKRELLLKTQGLKRGGRGGGGGEKVTAPNGDLNPQPLNRENGTGRLITRPWQLLLSRSVTLFQNFRQTLRTCQVFPVPMSEKQVCSRLE